MIIPDSADIFTIVKPEHDRNLSRISRSIYTKEYSITYLNGIQIGFTTGENILGIYLER